MPSFDQVDSAYQEFLGRPLSEPEYVHWAGNENYRAEIAGSPEAQSRRAVEELPTPAIVTRLNLPGPPEGYDAARWFDPNVRTAKYIFGRAFATGSSIAAAAALIGATPIAADAIQLANGDIIDVIRDFGGVNAQQWTFVGPAAAAAPIAAATPIPSAPVTLRTQVLNAAEASFPTESSPQFARLQRSGDFRSAISTGSTRWELPGAPTGLGIGAGQIISPGPTGQPRPGPRPTAPGKPGKLRKFFTAPLKLVARTAPGTRSIGGWIKRHPKVATAIGIGASLFIPGIAPAVAAGFGKIATGAKVAGGLVARGARSAIVAASKSQRPGIAGGAGTVPLETFPGAARAGVDWRGAIGEGVRGFLTAREEIAQQRAIETGTSAGIPDVLWDLVMMVEVGYVPDAPFYANMGGNVEVVIDAALDEEGLPMFLLQDGTLVTAEQWIAFELAQASP